MSGSREIIATTHRLSRYPIGATLVGAFVAAPRWRRRQESLALKFVFWDKGEFMKRIGLARSPENVGGTPHVHPGAQEHPVGRI